MLRNLPTGCLRCRLALAQSSKQNDPAQHVHHVSKRFRSKAASKPARNNKYQRQQSNPTTFRRVQRPSPFFEPIGKQVKAVPPENITSETCTSYLENSITDWTKNLRTILRFQQFGFATEDIKPLLEAYAKAGTSGFFSTPTNQTKYHLTRFANLHPSKPGVRQMEAEIIFSNIFFSWCLHTEDSAILDSLASQGKINPNTLTSVRYLAEVAQRRPAEEYPYARKMQRKIIMHVGPTNSGKTHHALRALAAAKTGVYAGPLRLLAHEIWERLNLGQIIPLGVEQPPPNTAEATPPTSKPEDLIELKNQPIAPEAQKYINPAYARKTNMITGEERKIVEEGASLLSCTVEMLAFRPQYDVGVIDEIQMIGDPHRGFAWTSAVLGLCANELHLCGEESAIPIVEALLQETGDELEVRRYERLTPLTVEEKSLDGDYSKVQRGDCVIAFSRGRIFEIKQEIESKSGLRCAVVYGKLPPEIRSEQAALFNDPHSGFDIMIGSDAIGMGLNLKIRRIIFDSVTKYDGSNRQIQLSISQTKQIAGRAGRYGHSLMGEAPGGYTTTLHQKDLPFLQKALSHPSTPTLTHAHVSTTIETYARIATALPSNATLETVQMAHVYASVLPKAYRYAIPGRVAEICEWIDERSKGMLTWAEKQMLMSSPVAWRDEMVVRVAEEMVRLQRDEMCVSLEAVVKPFGFMDALMRVEWQMERAKAIAAAAAGEARNARRPKAVVGEMKIEVLDTLETFHKVLVLYMWMNFRNNVVYPEREAAEDLKHRVEIVLDWGLQQLGKRDVAKQWQQTWSSARREITEGGVEAEGRVGHRRHPEISGHHPPSFATNPSPTQLPQDGTHISQVPPSLRLPPISGFPQRPEKPKIDYIKSPNEGMRAARQWDQPPDLSTLLKQYVNSPSLKVDGRK